MIVIMQAGAPPSAIQQVTARAEALGLRVHLSTGEERTVIGLIGDERVVDPDSLQSIPGVDRVVRVVEPYKLASRVARPDGSSVSVGQVRFGGTGFPVIAGPCAVEDEKRMDTIASAVAKAGASMLRGGAFKPRTNPYSFQGLGEPGLRILAQAGQAYGLPVVTEIMSPWDLDLVCRYASMLQVGSRNMHNFSLLQEVGRAGLPVMLKRGLSASIEEWLQAAEYVLSSGNSQVVLCERGIRTFEAYTRNTLDLSAVAAVKRLSHLPVIVDPSHAAGRWDLVIPLAQAALAVGADGVMVEVHPCPEEALSDGPQSLLPARFAELMHGLRAFAPVLGRTVEPGRPLEVAG
ncbi:MAG: 3-deoxy-7-phosphoheptulonate synthase [Bacillota bacterium]